MISYVKPLSRLRRQLPFQGSRLYRSVVASGGFAASSPFRGAVYIDQLLPQAASPPAPLSGEPVRRIAGCPSGGFAASSPFRGAVYIDQLLPQAASPPAPLSGEPSI